MTVDADNLQLSKARFIRSLQW